MDLNALFKISHGVYLTGAKDQEGRFIGSCIDSVMVVEADPQQIIVSMNNGSYTMENVVQSGEFTLSVLPDNAPNEVVTLFGTHTSRDTDKWGQTGHELYHDLPVYKDAVSYMYLKVKDTILTSGHHVFLCDVIDGQPANMGDPLLYASYQTRREADKGAGGLKHWKCSICGYIYNGETPFEELSEDWVCPLCNQPKSVFVEE